MEVLDSFVTVRVGKAISKAIRYIINQTMINVQEIIRKEMESSKNNGGIVINANVSQ